MAKKKTKKTESNADSTAPNYQLNYDIAKEAYRVDKNETTRKALLKAHKELKG